jgi:ABC-type polar amino acid transport system ATPase subunit
MVKDLLLSDKLDTLSSSLSGGKKSFVFLVRMKNDFLGMKRKLSVGIALIANSKVVILDEPTSGKNPNCNSMSFIQKLHWLINRNGSSSSTINLGNASTFSNGSNNSIYDSFYG